MKGMRINFLLVLNSENDSLFSVPRMIRNPDPSANQLFIFEGDSVPEIPKDKSIPAEAKPGGLELGSYLARMMNS